MSMKKKSEKHNQGEEALQISDELFRAIADYTVDWEMWISSDGELLWVNPTVERITGYSVTEVMSMGDLVTSFIVDEDHDKAKAGFHQAVKDGRVEDYEVRCRKKDGSIVCLSASWQMIKDKGGNSLGLRGSFRDISKRKQAEEVLRLSEEKYRRIMETANEGIWAMDRNHRTTFVNPRMAEMLGYEQAEIIGRQVEDFMFEEDLSAHQQRMLERHEGEPGIYHHRFRRRDGSEVWVEVSATALFDVNHEFDGSFAMFTDITRRKQAEESLRLNSVIFENLAEGVNLVRAEDGIILFANRRMEELLGYDAGELIGRDVATINAPTGMSPEEIREAIMRTLQQQGEWHGEIENICKDGKRIWCHADVSSFDHPGFGRVYISVHSDITAHKQGEEVLRESEERLRLAHKAANDVIWDWDIIHDAQQWNESGMVVFGWTEIVKSPQSATWWFERVHLEDRNRVNKSFFDVVGDPSRDRWEDEYRFLKADGEYAQVMDRGFVMRDEHGKAVRMIGAMLDITERKRAETALKDELNYRHILFEESPDGILIIDPETARFIEFNSAAHHQLGYTREEFAKLSIYDVEVMETPEMTRDRIASVIRDGKVDFETLQRTREGEIRDVSVTAQVINYQGNIVYQCIWRDITERKRVEEALRMSENRLAEINQLLSGILEHTTMMAVFLDGHFNFIWVNRAYAETCKQDLGFFTGKNHFDLYPNTENQQIFQQVVDTGKPFFVNAKPFEFPDQPERGITYWDWSLVPVKSENDEVSGLVFTLVEVTEKVQDQERLKESKANLQSWFNAVDESVFLCTRDGIVLTCNETFAARVGRSPVECIGYSAYDMIPPEVAVRRKAVMDKVLQTGSAIEFEDERQGRWLHHRISPVFGADGAVDRLAIYAQDVTERKKSEEALQRSTELLDSIRRAQSIFIEQGDTHAVFDELLQIIVKMTGSEFGFLDELRHDEKGTPYKLNLAISNISWDKESEALYEQLRSRNLEFRDLNNLAGLPATLGEPVITGDDRHDPRSGGLPSGHPPIHAFMGLPVRSGGEVIGVAGVANRPGGYDKEMAHFLEPYLTACAGIIESVRLRTREREAIEALRESESRVQKKLHSILSPDEDIGSLELADIIDVEKLQNLMDGFYHLTKVPNAIIDLKGNVLVATGWQDICTKFHRRHPETLNNCIECDTVLSEDVQPGTFKTYLCKNGLRDCVTPLMVGGQHVGNLFTGQFFFESDRPGEDFFREQAAKYGFDEAEYLEAFRKVPVWNEKTINAAFEYYATLASMITSLSHGNIVLARMLEERKRSEEDREKLQEQLNQAQKMEAVGRLAGGVAHDFNNQLGVIIGYCEMALDRVNPDDPLHEDLMEVLKAAQRSADTTRQLLAFARKQTARPRVLNLNDAVSGMTKMLGRLIGEDIKLSLNICENLPQVKIDPSQVDQILANLAINARDAISGTGIILIETANEVLDGRIDMTGLSDFAKGEYVRLSMRDSGCGMDQETLDHIFEPFFTTKKLGEGTGLGLATVYGIVRQNDGYIRAKSVPGMGTTFDIYLPPFRTEPAVEKPETRSSPILGNKQLILLVEDEESVLKLGKRILEELGYMVLTSRTPENAIRIVMEQPGRIDLLITDVVMPGMHGRELERRIRQIRPNLNCLYMSGYTADVIASRGMLDEGVPFIQKPFSIEALADKVHEILGL